MPINIRSITFCSSNGEDTVSAAAVYADTHPPRGVVLISHGMIEHIGRYHDFMMFLAQNGYAAFGHDHLGHGKTARDREHLGYFAHEGGYKHLIRDVRQLGHIAQSMFPEKPQFLIGHSMGSLVARLYCLKFSESIAGAAFLGTPGPNILTPAALMLAGRFVRRGGEMSRPATLQRLTIDDFNRKFIPARTPKDWLSRDEEAVDKNLADEWCNFTFTASAFQDLYSMMELANASSWAKSYPKTLPTLLLSGDCDPVGDFGRGVLKVYNRLLSAGVTDLTFELYPGARHELLQETNREEVYQDILEWLHRYS